MSLGKVLKFIPRKDLATQRLEKVLARDIAKEDLAFAGIPGVSDPIDIGTSRKGLQGVMELDPGNFDPKTMSGNMRYRTYYHNPKTGENYNHGHAGEIGRYGFNPYRNYTQQAIEDNETFKSLMEILDWNKKPNVFFADGSEI
jgi:hypothetical protein